MTTATQPSPQHAAGVVIFKINGEEVSAGPGQTILDVARENEIDIPTLCYLDGLTTYGACRLCLVEIKGSPRLLPACVAKPTEGIEVITNSPRLQKYRKRIIELLLAERNHTCSVCVSNGRCELQAMAQKLGVNHIEVPYRFPHLSVDSSHDRFRQDQNRCILCTRCVRMCSEIEGAHTKDISGRGIDALIINDLSQPWGSSTTCTTCGKCVHVCPTGTLTEKGTSTGEMTKKSGFLPYLTQMREVSEFE